MIGPIKPYNTSQSLYPSYTGGQNRYTQSMQFSLTGSSPSSNQGTSSTNDFSFLMFLIMLTKLLKKKSSNSSSMKQAAPLTPSSSGTTAPVKAASLAPSNATTTSTTNTSSSGTAASVKPASLAPSNATTTSTTNTSSSGTAASVKPASLASNTTTSSTTNASSSGTTASTSSTAPGSLASPPAIEGFGATTQGGKNQPVYHVTNLNDSGPGSLRDAVSKGYVNVVFDVEGTIKLQSSISISNPYITIDGLSAPGKGITIEDYGIEINGKNNPYNSKSDAHDIIVRGLRFRPTENPKPGTDIDVDALGVYWGAHHIVIDHNSFMGDRGGDELIDMSGSDVTISWNHLQSTHHAYGLLLAGGERVSIHHNLFDTKERNPLISKNVNGPDIANEVSADFRNNLVVVHEGGTGTVVSDGAKANVVNNFFTPAFGSESTMYRGLFVAHLDKIDALKADPWIRAFRTNQVVPSNVRHDGYAFIDGNVSSISLQQGTPDLNSWGTENRAYAAASVSTQDARTAAKDVYAHAGVLRARNQEEIQALQDFNRPS